MAGTPREWRCTDAGRTAGTDRVSRRTFFRGHHLAVRGWRWLAWLEEPENRRRKYSPTRSPPPRLRGPTPGELSPPTDSGRRGIDLGGTVARTLAYNNSVPGPLIRANVGDELAVTRQKRPRPSDVGALAWHRLAQRHGRRLPRHPRHRPGRDFTYRFSVPHSGTYWAHPHTGLDADYGLYLPVIVDDPNEPGEYDAEWIVVLDDWTDGVGKRPEQIWTGPRRRRRRLRTTTCRAWRMPGMPGMEGVGTSDLLGGDAGDINYPYYLINGRIPAAPTTFTAKPGQRIRMRIINAGSDTAFRVALAGHPMTVTHTDGFPVVPTEVDALLVGMGERYDVIVTAGDGVFPLVAWPRERMRWRGHCCPPVPAMHRTPAFGPPSRPAHRNGRHVRRHRGGSPRLRCCRRHAHRRTDRVDDGATTGRSTACPSPTPRPMTLEQGQRVHPHLQQHHDDVASDAPARAHLPDDPARRQPGRAQGHRDRAAQAERSATTFVADNPGVWMMHCHNTYHQEAGMMTSLDYAT